MTDNDQIILEDAKESAFTMDKAYRRAMLSNDIDAMVQLKPKVNESFDLYSKARLRLFEEGVIATDEDVAQLRRIRADIDQAATTQALIMGAVKFIGFIKKFV